MRCQPILEGVRRCLCRGLCVAWLAGASLACGAPHTKDAIAGKALFEHYCRTCHTLGGGRRVGPDLRGVVKRRERKWLVRFIDDPAPMLRKDPVARALLAEYEGRAMASSGLSRQQIDDVLAYLESASDADAMRKREEAPPRPAP